MPVAGTGYLSGSQPQFIDGTITNEWVNLSLVQIFEVKWEDGEVGELELPDVCKYATAWDKVPFSASTGT